MSKLITKAGNKPVQVAPVLVNPISQPTIQQPDDGGERTTSNVDSSPISFTFQPITPLSWKLANLGIAKLSINATIRDWMDHDTAIRNWVHTCLTAFTQLPNVFTWSCPIPDQWIDEMGGSEIIFHWGKTGEVSICN